MPTLNKTTKEAKIILKWGGIAGIIILVCLTGIRFATIIKERLTPPPPPQSLFGKLPLIPFPNQQKENITYSVDTITGFLPNFGDRAKVYKISTNPPNLLALDKAKEKIAQIGFNPNAAKITQDIYQWTDQASSLQRKITINLFSLDFTLSSPYLITPSLQTFANLDEQNSAVDLAKSFLSNMSLLTDDLNQEKIKTSLYSIEKSTLIPTAKISDAKIVRVDFSQKDIDTLPIYYEDGIASTIYLLIGKNNNQLTVLETHYFHKNVSQVSSAYGIKSAQEAFVQLKQGKAYIVSMPQNTTEISIKNAVLGYYIGEINQDFLMPVIIFQGDNGFLAYVSAVRDEWINN